MPDKKTVDVVKEVIQNSKTRKFEESIELGVNLRYIDMTNPKNRIDENIVLPKGRGKEIKVGIFCGSELAERAKGVADLVISPEEIEDIADNRRKARKMAEEYNFFLAEVSLMPVIGRRLGIILAPRGKMPTPILPSVDPIPIITNLKNTVKMRSKDKHTFHVSVGTKDMSPEDIAENIETVLKRLETKLERGKFNIGSVYVKSTMGKSVKLW